MLEIGLERLTMLKEDAMKMAAEDLHELMRAWENYHRILAGEAHLGTSSTGRRAVIPATITGPTFPKIDDAKWKVFTISQYDMKTNEWKFETKPYVQLVK